MAFINRLKLSPVPNRKQFELLEDFLYHWVSRKRFILIPAGTETDFATVPNWVRFLIDNDDKHLREPAVLHDFLYSTASTCDYPISRVQADRLFRLSAQEMGSPRWKYQLVYAAVRVFGAAFYKKTPKKERP